MTGSEDRQLNYAANTRFLLLRHAETMAPEIFHGAESDVPLSERGRRHAAAVATLIAAERPVAVISSAMQRSVDTAMSITAAAGVSLQVEPALHERRVGLLSGTQASTSNDVWRATLERWKAGDFEYAPAGAESFAAIRRRVMPVWNRLVIQFASQTAAIIVHGVTIRTLLISLLPEFQPFGWSEIGISNLGLNEVVFDGAHWKAIRLNQKLDG